MIRLRERQFRFLAELLNADSVAGDNQDARREARMEIYRNNYRSAIIEALAETFERTARLAGHDAFRQAAIHHVIEQPSASWTLDLVGEGFADTCRALFANDEDVAEVAMLEWAMARAFTARDATAMTLEEFAAATSAFGEEDWASLALRFVPGMATAPVLFDLPRLWRSLEEDQSVAEVYRSAQPGHIVVWREGETPVFQTLPDVEGSCLAKMSAGARFEDICDWLSCHHDASEAARLAGAMLHHWLTLGLIETLGGAAQTARDGSNKKPVANSAARSDGRKGNIDGGNQQGSRSPHNRRPSAGPPSR